mmetsp:Transcript_32179/g.80579  ORF Transcript_32179/g.80579 Transcript_32179/m.80579 type:complete len:235 (+) Transcript_32179:243-947(+)
MFSRRGPCQPLLTQRQHTVPQYRETARRDFSGGSTTRAALHCQQGLRRTPKSWFFLSVTVQRQWCLGGMDHGQTSPSWHSSGASGKRRNTTAMARLRRALCAAPTPADGEGMDWASEPSDMTCSSWPSLTLGEFHHSAPLDFGLHPSELDAIQHSVDAAGKGRGKGPRLSNVKSLGAALDRGKRKALGSFPTLPMRSSSSSSLGGSHGSFAAVSRSLESASLGIALESVGEDRC